jgi:hypothetical protein
MLMPVFQARVADSQPFGIGRNCLARECDNQKMIGHLPLSLRELQPHPVK